MKASGEAFTLELPWAPGHTVTGPKAHVDLFVDSIQRQRLARTQWPENTRAAMTALGRMFPSMVRFDGSTVPGIDPWEPGALVHWLNTSGEPTSGSRTAALFLLSVWNSGDWREFGLQGDDGGFAVSHFSKWDDKHRAAALAWFLNPFWP